MNYKNKLDAKEKARIYQKLMMIYTFNIDTCTEKDNKDYKKEQ